jgi:type IV pilus assembly protein PilM
MRTPSFLQLPVYSVDISDLNLKFLRLIETHDGVELDDFGESKIAPGIIEGGEIKDISALSELLKREFKKHNVEYVAFSLPEEKGYVRTLKMEHLSEEELGSALELQLEEHIPLPASEAVFDYTVASREKTHLDVVLNAFPKRIVFAYIESMQRAGVLPVLLESELRSVLRSIIPKNADNVGMLIDWGSTRITFAIFHNHILRFTTTVPLPGQGMTEAIAKEAKVDLKEAERLKKKYGFKKTKESENIFNALVPAVSAIKDESEKYMQFYETHNEDNNAVSYVMLAGGDASIPGLSEYMTSELKKPVRVGNPWENVKFPQHYLPNLSFRESYRFAASIGLSLRALEECKYFSVPTIVHVK